MNAGRPRGVALALRRGAAAGWLAAYLLAGSTTPAEADDCSSPEDCKAPPGNASAATGLAAGLATLSIAWAATAWRQQAPVFPPVLEPPPDPCAELGAAWGQARGRLTQLDAIIGDAEEETGDVLDPDQARSQLERTAEDRKQARLRKENLEATMATNPGDPDEPRWRGLIAAATERLAGLQQEYDAAAARYAATQPGPESDRRREAATRLHDRFTGLAHPLRHGSGPSAATVTDYIPRDAGINPEDLARLTPEAAARMTGQMMTRARIERAALQDEAAQLQRAYDDCLGSRGTTVVPPEEDEGLPLPVMAQEDEGLPLPVMAQEDEGLPPQSSSGLWRTRRCLGTASGGRLMMPWTVIRTPRNELDSWRSETSLISG